jgi:Arc/MetJ family transcription regulator
MAMVFEQGIHECGITSVTARSYPFEGAQKKYLSKVWHACHTLIMKMTMHIDEDTLASVMEITGSTSKTGAVEKALTEMVRRHRLKSILKEGMGMTPEEIKDSFDFASYDASDTSAKITKKAASYRHARKPSR